MKYFDGLGYFDKTNKYLTLREQVIQRNLLQFPFDFDNAYWFKGSPNRVTVTANNTTAPDGTMTADRINETAATGFHSFYDDDKSSVVNTKIYKYSFYVKKGNVRWVQSGFGGTGFGTTSYYNFDLDNLAFGDFGAGILDKGYENIGNGWLRLWATSTAITTNTAVISGIVGTTVSGTATRLQSFLGNANNYTYFWGAKLERIS